MMISEAEANDIAEQRLLVCRVDSNLNGDTEYVRRFLSSEIVAAWVLSGETAISRTRDVICGWVAELDNGREVGSSAVSSEIE